MDNREREKKGDGSANDVDRRDFLKFCSAVCRGHWPGAVVWFQSRRRAYGGGPATCSLAPFFGMYGMHRSDA